jgi:hypothetical protein
VGRNDNGLGDARHPDHAGLLICVEPGSMPDLAEHHQAPRDEFRSFFPELIRHVEGLRREA